MPTEKNGTDRNGVRRYPTRRRRRKPAKTETEIALDAILVDSGSDFAGTLQQQYHFTPETPVSEHGLDVLPASPVLSKRQSKGFHTLENSIEMEIEFEPEIERIVREDDAVNDEVVAAAAKNFEGLDEKGI